MSKELVLTGSSTTHEINNGLQQVHNEAMLGSALGAMFAMPKENFATVTADYFTFLENTTYKMVVTGMSIIDFPDEATAEVKPTPVVEFTMFDPATIKINPKTKEATGDLKQYVSGAAVFAGTVEKLIKKTHPGYTIGDPLNHMIGLSVECLKKVGGANRKYIQMEIGQLFATQG